MKAWRGVRAGTPIHNQKSLCYSCRHSQIIKGEAQNEEYIRCGADFSNRPFTVPFKIVECNKYSGHNTPSLYEMEKMAFVIETDPRGKPIGFRSNQEFRKNSGLNKDDSITP